MTIPVSPGALRVSSAEREPVVERLQQAYADGRLDKAELDTRLHLAMTAKTRGELDAVLGDLVAAPAPAAPPVPAPYVMPYEPTANERLLASLAHVLGIATLFFGPLIMYCTRARRSPYVRAHLTAALNFQLTLLMVAVVTLGIGAIAYAFSWAVAAVAAVLALVGEPFRYPFTLRVFR